MNFLALMLTLVATSAFAHAPHHMDLEMTSEEYAALLKNKSVSEKQNIKADDPAISSTIKLGARLSKWVTLVNANRPEGPAIRLTSPATRHSSPIDKPNIYSPSIIANAVKTTLSEMPESMREVVTGNAELPTTIGMDDETFILHARRLDRNYQSAARYKTVDEFRSEYIQAANSDIRGYYYLTQNKIGVAELTDLTIYPATKLEEIKNALLKLCLNNSKRQSTCKKELDKAVRNNQVAAFYTAHFAKGEQTWKDFFVIPSNGRRSDIQWAGNVAVVPFNTPELPKFIPYLQNNIEDEFRWKDWGMKIEFGQFENGPRLKFVPGVVPHVNGLGGNEIVMDSNQPIEEYESQWTIRHEFGHVIGLPDCYHEFYDVEAKAYVSYQLDITDLMCSRAGNMNERIYLELKKAYAK